MNILRSISAFVPVRPPSLVPPPCLNSLPLFSFGLNPNIHVCPSHSVKFPPASPNPTCALGLPITAANPSNQETVSVVEFEEFVEKDWSFLEFDDTNIDGEHMQKIDRIISAGNIKEPSKILVSIGSEAFVDRIVSSSPCEHLFVVHDSLLVLACIKERHDRVKCWQGELIDVPEKWTAFDVVYLYFLPALSFELDQVLEALAKHCLPGSSDIRYPSPWLPTLMFGYSGARVVISHPYGREAVEEQKQQYPDVVVSDLPEKMTLQSTAANNSFQMLEFLDEPGFYLAVMRFNQD